MKLSCKDVSRMVSESLDRTLSMRERLGVKIHLLMCNACRRMSRQMQLLRATALHIRSAEQAEPDTDHESLSKKARARIRERLRNAKDDPLDYE